jgi:hypothetical protein
MHRHTRMAETSVFLASVQTRQGMPDRKLPWYGMRAAASSFRDLMFPGRSSRNPINSPAQAAIAFNNVVGVARW